MAGRGGRGWFAVDSKSFDISIEVAGGKLKSVIVEKARGLSEIRGFEPSSFVGRGGSLL